MLPSDLTAVELKYADRDVLAERVAQLQAHLRRPCGECHPCDNHNWSVEITDEMAGSVRAEAEYMGFDLGDGNARTLARAALEAAGFTVADGGEPS